MSILDRSVLGGFLLAVCATQAVAEFAWRVDSPAEIQRILPGAVAGDIFELGPGNWGPLSLRGIRADGGDPLTLRAQDPLNPPVLTSLDLNGASNIAIDGVQIALPQGGLAVDLQSARDIDLSGLSIIGQGAGTGFDVTNSQRVAIREAVLTGLGSGLIGSDAQHLSLIETEMADLTGTGVGLQGGGWITLDGNRFTGFSARLERPDQRPPDMVHIGLGRDTPSHLLIKDNLLDSGGGPVRPGIVLGDALEQHTDRPAMQDLTVSGNLIVTPSHNGLVLGPVQGAHISGNAVLRTRQGQYRKADPQTTTPELRLSTRSRDITLQDNWAARFPVTTGLPGWKVHGNIIAQDHYHGQADHYDLLFQNPNAADPLVAFQPRPGSVLATLNSGPGLLRARLSVDPENLQTTSASEAATVWEFLTYDAANGLVTSRTLDGTTLESLDVNHDSIPLGGLFPVWDIPRDMVSPIFNTRQFTLRLRLMGRDGRRNGGEVLRIHNWLVLDIDDAGGVILNMRSGESPWRKLSLRTARITGEDWQDIEIHFDTRAKDGLLRLSAGADLVQEVTIHGPTPPLESWNLSLGNPFGNRDTWEGEIGNLTLSSASRP